MHWSEEGKVGATIARVLEYWERTEAGARPGVSAEALRQFEGAHAVRIPREMAEFYQAADGMRCDRQLLIVWPLAEVGRVPGSVATYRGTPDFGPITRTLPAADEYFAFADSMCWSHVYATRLTPAGEDSPVLWICGAAYEELAPSFGAYWERYLRDPESVVWPGIAE
jgi:hypothetical protein